MAIPTKSRGVGKSNRSNRTLGVIDFDSLPAKAKTKGRVKFADLSVAQQRQNEDKDIVVVKNKDKLTILAPTGKLGDALNIIKDKISQ